MAFLARRFKAEGSGNSIEQRIVGNLRNSDGAISLHIRMATQWRYARSFPSNVAAEQEQVCDLLDVAGTMAVLRNSHAVINDDPFCLGINVGHLLDRSARQPRSIFDRIPGCRVDIRQQSIDSGRMRFDELTIENAWAACRPILLIERNQGLHYPLQHGDV